MWKSKRLIDGQTDEKEKQRDRDTTSDVKMEGRVIQRDSRETEIKAEKDRNSNWKERDRRGRTRGQRDDTRKRRLCKKR